MSKLEPILSGAVAPGVYRFTSRMAVSSARRAVEAAGWRFFHLDGSAITDKTSFLCACSSAMAFPDYFGFNWDALDECLRDLSWAPARGYVILYDAVRRFAYGDPEAFAIARSCLEDASTAWRQRGTPMVVLLRGSGAAARDLSRFPQTCK